MAQDYIRIKEVEVAYDFFKHEVYDDYNNLINRKKIVALEETGIKDAVFGLIAESINSAIDGNFEKIDSIINQGDLVDDMPSYLTFPHTFEKRDFPNSHLLLYSDNNNFRLSKVVVFYNQPITLDIINVLWLFRVGKYLTHQSVDGKWQQKDRNLYGSVLRIDAKGDFYDNKLFTNYSINYKRWINKGAIKAKEAIDHDSDIALISLDLKDFYHSVRLDYGSIPVEGDSIIGKTLNIILGKAAAKHMADLGYEDVSSSNAFLPIGPYSSPVIANWILGRVDEALENEERVVYYGRYIDDMFLVLSSDHLNISPDITLSSFINQVFHNQDTFDIEGDSVNVIYQENRRLQLNEEKFQICHLHHNDELSISSFVHNLELNGSFECDPYEEETDEDHDEETENQEGTNVKSEGFGIFHQQQIDKFNDFLKGNNLKYEISRQVADSIMQAVSNPVYSNEQLVKDVFSLFQGNSIFEFYSLWERILTFFVASENLDKISKLLNLINSLLQKITVSDDLPVPLEKADIEKSVKESLMIHLSLSLAIATSYNPNFVEQLNPDLIKLAHVKSLAIDFRHHLMLRKGFLPIPFLFYTSFCIRTTENLFDKSLWNRLLGSVKIKLNFSDKNKYPKPPSLLDICMCEMISCLRDSSRLKTDVFHTASGDSEYLDNIRERYNKYHASELKISNEDTKKNPVNSEPKVRVDIWKLVNTRKVYKSLKVAIANIKLDEDRVIDNINNRPNLTAELFNRHLNLIQNAIKEKAQMLIMPEVFVPIQYVYNTYGHATQFNRCSFIFGIEHFSIKGTTYNISCILLPIIVGHKQEALLIPRVKNYYSPCERKTIKKLKKKVPILSRAYYDWIDWHGIQFTLFNCFELTNIRDRSIFKNWVDLLIAIEYNRDIHLYSNIAEATPRDNDCFFIQANSSDYGDSRIVEPRPHDRMNVVRLKGGENDVIVTYTLKIKEFRDYLMGISIPKERDNKTSKYKPTAAGFDKSVVSSRINRK